MGYAHSPSIAASLEKLRFSVLPLRLNDCLVRLHTYADGVAPLALHRHFFPDDYARSSAPLSLAPPGALSPREMEFLRLVDHHLFPIDPYVYDSVGGETDGHLLTQMGIDIVCLGAGDWYDDYPDGLEPLLQIVLVLSGQMSPADLNFSFSDLRDAENIARAMLWGWQGDAPLSTDRLLERTHATGSPLAGLLDAIDLLDHQTGSPWLDIYNGMSFDAADLTWTVENIEWLRQNYHDHTLPILVRLEGLRDYLTADFAPHLQEVMELWKSAQAPKTAHSPSSPAPSQQPSSRG